MAQPIYDCSNAVVVCSSDDQAFNPDGPGANDFADPDNDPGCIPGLETNSAWYYFQINANCPPGLELGFIIHPDGGYGVDYDWALFGPNVDCGNLGSPLRCSGASFDCQFCPETGMGMGATDYTEGPGFGDGFTATILVQPGEGYYLLINNWLPTNTGFILEWTGPAADYLNCNVTPPCALYANAGTDINVCQGEPSFSLNGSSSGNHGTETYNWTGTNGGTAFLNDPGSPMPTVDLPPGYTGVITFILTVEEDNCVSEDTMELTVYDLPDIIITPAGPFCENDPPQTLTATPSGGIWGGDNNGNTFDPMAHGPGNYMITYSYTSADNCTNTSFIEIEVYDLPDLTIDPDPAAFCADDGFVVLTAESNSGTGPYAYTWSTPSGTDTGSSYNATVAGQHTVWVTDVNGCTNMSGTMVTIHPNPIVDIANPGPVCQSAPPFMLTGTPPGGVFSGTIITPAGEIDPAVTPPGSYPIQYHYTDTQGCEGDASIDITIVTIPDAMADNNSPVCEGEPIELFGTTSLTGPGIAYLWTGPNGYISDFQNPTDAIEGGMYTFIVDVNGCVSAPAQTEVVVWPEPDAVAFNTGPYCPGDAIQLMGSTNATGNTISFTWIGPNGYSSNAQNPSDAIEPGMYQLTVDVDGCTSTQVSTLVTLYTFIQPVIAGQDTFCAGFSSILDAGSGYASYLWEDASTLSTREVFSTGTYHVTVTDGQGCTGEASLTATEMPPLTPLISGSNEFCEGSATLLDAGSGYSSYAWSSGASTQTLPVTTGGNYNVQVVDAYGCSGTAQMTVVEHSLPVVMISGSTTYCPGGSTTLDAGSGFISYEWNSGALTPSISVMTPGLYSISVMDVNGCSGSADVNVYESYSLHPVISGNTSFCENSSTLLSAGSGFASYLWSDGTTNPFLNVNIPGTYAVTVTDGGSCSGDTSITISEVTPPFAVLQDTAFVCNTISGGAVLNLYALILSGDVNGSWTDTDASGAVGSYHSLDFSSVPPGEYQFIYTTHSAMAPCPESTYQVVVVVKDCTCPEVSFLNSPVLCNAGDIIDLSTLENTAQAGTWALVTAPQGNHPGILNGTWFGADDADPGIYTLQFSLLQPPPPGCPTEWEIGITVERSTNAGIAMPPATYCAGDTHIIHLADLLTGEDSIGTWSEISALPSTGNAFDPSEGLFTLLELNAGWYTFEYMVPTNGVCPGDTSEISVVISPAPNATIADFGILDCIHPIQQLDASGSTVGQDDIIVWSGPPVIIDGQEHTLHPTINKPGLYILTIIDTLNGCYANDSVTVNLIDSAIRGAAITVDHPDCFGDTDGMIQIDTISGGTAPYVYSLNQNLPSAPYLFSDLTAGEYHLTLTDATGCQWDTTLVLSASGEIIIDLGPDLEAGLGKEISLEAMINLPLDQIDSIIWLPSGNFECLDAKCIHVHVLASGTMDITATAYDISGCSAEDQVRLTIYNNKSLYIPNTFSPNGDGINDDFFASADPDQVSMIRKMAIFSRWGEMIFQATDILPNDPTHGWDGYFKNKPVNPGAYLYYIEVMYIDGTSGFYTGTVTLIK